MDPISAVGLVTSIIQLIETTAKTISYVNDVKDAPAERAQFARHASSLLALLTDLRYRVEEAKDATESDPWFAALRSLGVKEGPLDQLHDQMERLGSKLAPSDGRLKRAGRALLWTLDRKEVERILDQIERVKTLVSLALQNDQFALSLRLKEDLGDVKGELREMTEKHIAEQEDVETQKILAWLSKLDFSAKQVDFLRRRQPGTGEWLLSNLKFQRWVEGQDHLLWCPGLPGAGKTTLASMVIDWLENRYRGTDTAVTYLYFSYREEEAQTPVEVMGSILQQLVKHSGSNSEQIGDAYASHMLGSKPLAMDDLMRLLSQQVRELPRVFIVVDALDECPERGNTRSEVLAQLHALLDNACILVTSRYSPRIDDIFQYATQIEILAADEDVKRYVEARVKKERLLAKCVLSDPALMDEITKTIIDNSQGMFLLAQLHMDTLAKKLNRRQVRAALAVLPKELDETYDQVLSRIRKQDEDQVILAHKVLYWISCSIRPLAFPELQHALAVEPGDRDLDPDGICDIELMVAVCAGLVTVDEESNHIRLVHYTTQSYLDRIGISQWNLSQGVPSAGEICLTYLLFKPFSERYCTDCIELHARRERYPFLVYAASYWSDHVRNMDDDRAGALTRELLGHCISRASAGQQALEVRRTFPGTYAKGSSRIPGRLRVAASLGLVDILRELISAPGCSQQETLEEALFDATETNQIEAVRLLLEAGALVEPPPMPESELRAKHEQGLWQSETPLHVASRNGNEPLVRLLLDAGADPNRVTLNGSALHIAAQEGHTEVARLLLEHGADINLVDPIDHSKMFRGYAEKVTGIGFTPLGSALLYDRTDLVSFLLDQGADVLITRCPYNRTTVQLAVRIRNLGLVQRFLAQGVDARATNVDGWTALHEGAGWVGSEATELVHLLVANGADVLAEDRVGMTPLRLAAEAGNDDVVEAMLEHIPEGRCVPVASWRLSPTLQVAFWHALEGEEGAEDRVRVFLEQGADPNIGLQDTYLVRVVSSSRARLLRLLLKHGADTELRDKLGRTALHWAASRSWNAGVQLLLDHGADVEAVDELGATPLHFAVVEAMPDVVRQLLDNGAPLNAKDSNGRTPLSWTSWHGRFPRSPTMGRTPHSSNSTDSDETTESTKNTKSTQCSLDQWGEVRSQERLEVFNLLVSLNAVAHGPPSEWTTTMLKDICGPGTRATGVIPVARRLIEMGADIHTEMDHYGGVSLFYSVVYFLEEDMVRFFLEQGANPMRRERARVPWLTEGDSRVVNGETALHAAARSGKYATCQVLIEFGADIHAVREDGSTPILEAFYGWKENRTPIEYMIDYGIDFDYQGNSRTTIGLLLDHGIDINNHYGEERRTLLHIASIEGAVDTVRYLVDRGANIAAEDANGKTAQNLAQDKGDEVMAHLLARCEAERRR